MRGEGSGEVSDITYLFTSMNEGGLALIYSEERIYAPVVSVG